VAAGLRQPGDRELVLPHEEYGSLWFDEHYRTWRRQIYKPSADPPHQPRMVHAP
jgi:hypothetical protein